MTCIIGLAKNGVVYMGGDSATANDTFIQTLCAHKVFKIGPVLLGCSGSHRVLQVLRHKLIVEHVPFDTKEEYIVNYFIGRVKEVLKEQGLLQSSPEGDVFDGAFLLGYQGCLFTICSDFSAQEYVDNCDALGSGREYALGAMAALVDLEPEIRISRALEIAARFTPNVRDPFYVEILE